MKEIRMSWAIKGQITGHPKPYFLGIFNFIGGPLEPCREGTRIGLFRTRKQARDEAKKHAWAKARAIRVKVIIEEV